jgi:hypothetical protein
MDLSHLTPDEHIALFQIALAHERKTLPIADE